MATKKRWIQDIHMRKGALTKAAKDAGESISKFCSHKDSLSTTNKRRCNLRNTLRSFHKK